MAFAILGAGIFATEAYIPALSQLGESVPTLKAVYSRSKESAQNLSQAAFKHLSLDQQPDIYHDGEPSANLQVLLARQDIQAVIIALPITVQPGVVLACLEAGKHVLSEKPVAPDVKQGLNLIRKYRSQYEPKGLIWRVAENFEAEPVYQTAGTIIKQGKIGKVSFFKAIVVNYIDENSKWYKTPWRTVPDYQGGFLLDGGVHTIASLRVILPKPLTHLSSFASLNKQYLAPHDTVNVIAKADSDFHGIVELTWASPTKSTPVSDGLVVTGTDGWLSINRIGDSYRITIKSLVRQEGKSATETEETVDIVGKGIEVECQSFFNRIMHQNETSDLGDPFDALKDVAFIEAALNSDGNLKSLVDLVMI